MNGRRRLTQAAWRRATEWPLIAAALLYTAGFAWQVIEEPGGPLGGALEVGLWLLWAVFAADYVVMIVTAHDRARWFVRNLHELLLVVLPMFRPLRLLRLISVAMMLERRIGPRIQGRVFLYGLSSALLVVLIGSIAVLDAEKHAPGTTITTFGDALWWAVVTITTAGYGDLYPVTPLGRLIAVGLMISGIAVIGLVTATLASWLMQRVVSEEIVEEVEDEEAPLRRQVAVLTEQVARLSAQVDRLAGAPRSDAATGDSARRPEH
ncbi:ion transporter [Tersicoccus solisilvae]|uniref:Ion transporter n=1 Tax=Tersicoccus solisilvae TaxID=1882339 RepID=A0ABQ1NZN0_9MICC|nr:potassium channel family protein [Tersicoccus solisilvae]GGC86552.1 ion transporter [Tersicoccus solisilvae]